ncbi:TIM-barrel domain-containing protein [Breznakia pachnodae]|uniref:Alpha-glucosidase (Family GH31 glycosyl hydrolase) n=1 Tax=Breznakia pachnodae TaxID=265178 RepID=A0ABU0E092_9FIRM|nr:TIM-barrel domain-containing protein [Breznakia pachnodae]MDQ0360307.1 alpha-glucosidase (family GH31 glycosyl hydrolase) [Breznakia pachnodae]
MKKKIMYLLVSFAMVAASMLTMPRSKVLAAETIDLTSIDSASVDDNVVTIKYNDGIVGKITFLEDGIFRFYIDPTGEFNEYAEPSSKDHKATIQNQSDSSDDYTKPTPTIKESDKAEVITAGSTVIILNKETATMSVAVDGKEVLAESSAITLGDSTKQTLKTDDSEYFYGGGTQNGRFSHKGQVISISNTNKWTDGGVASPNPFYWSTKGYGVLRNTFKQGSYDFRNNDDKTISTQHSENRFDAYYFLGNKPADILKDYYKVTGNPTLLPEYAFYLGHLNAYNRDTWSQEQLGDGTATVLEDGNTYYEYGRNKDYKMPLGDDGKIAVDSPYIPETLNGTSPLTDKSSEELYKFSARAVIDGYADNDMPLGWFLPNDGYGAGYGQNGYYQNYPLGTSDDKDAQAKAVDGNINNLKEFTDYANEHGVATGLWTQSGLDVATSEKDKNGYHGYQTLRDFDKEVNVAGIQSLKTDVAWVGSGYSFGLNATKTAFEKIASTNTRPNIVTLDGWAGSQRHAAIWTGDQTGGKWEYIRFHIPTYIGQSLSGNPNIGSDMDGIFGGSTATNVITTRDFQWKVFTPLMLDMDGWGSIAKKPYGHGDDFDDMNRMYLKLKAQLMPYIYTTAQEATDGLPMIRAMFLEYPDDELAYGDAVQYQYMFGENFLVAPIYQDTASDDKGNDVRNDIYLPDSKETWIDYFTGKSYKGGQILNNFDAPVWKLPLFVKSGSIVPMYEDNNNPFAQTETNDKGLDKTKRIVEFFPSTSKGTTSYTSYEDDGMYIDGVDENGNEKSDVSYGGSVSTEFTSTVKDGTATLVAKSSTGSYTGYDSNRSTKFVVNMSAEPTKVSAKNGSKDIELMEAKNQVEFDSLVDKGQGAYFYNETPDLNKYATGDGEFSKTKITTTPKLYVSFPKTDVSVDEQTLVIKGYKYTSEDSNDKENATLETPVFAEQQDGDITATSIKLNWNKITDADSYELKVDGILRGGFTADTTTFNHEGLIYSSEHTYQVRARNADGYSKWSDELKLTTDADPWKDTLVGTPTYEGEVGWGNLESAFDQKLDDTYFRSAPNQLGKAFIVDYKGIYNLDKFTYVARSDYATNGLGDIYKLDLYTSLDGQNWTKVFDGKTQPWAEGSTAEKKYIDMNNLSARYLKIVPLEGNSKDSNGNDGYTSVGEFILDKVPGSTGYDLGDFNLDGEIGEDDVTQIKNYKGLLEGNTSFESQIASKNADVNKNGVFDIYDYSFVMNKVDGGTTNTGNAEGSVYVDVDKKETVKAGETFDVAIKGNDLKNVNALGAIFTYDKTKYELVSVTPADTLKDMLDLSSTSSKDGSNDEVETISFANHGDKDMISGNIDLMTIKMKAKQDADVVFPNEFMLIGPQNNLVNAQVTRGDVKADKSELTALVKESKTIIDSGNKLAYTVDSWNAFTNAYTKATQVADDEDVLTKDVLSVQATLKDAKDGLTKNTLKPGQGVSDITFMDGNKAVDATNLWQQANWKKLLFDGDTTTSMAEFKWFIDDKQDITAEVKLPMDMHFIFDQPRSISEVRVYNRISKANTNGIVTSIFAKGITTDGKEVNLGSYEEAKDIFTFTYNGVSKKSEGSDNTLFKEIIITPKTSTGSATGTKTGSEENRMLSLYEIEIDGNNVLDTSKYDEFLAKANGDLSNYTDDSIASLKGVKEAAEALMTTANEQTEVDQAVAELQSGLDALVVKETPVDSTILDQKLEEAKNVDVSLYDETSAANLTDVIAQAEELVKTLATQEAIDQMVQSLSDAITALQEKEAETTTDETVVDKNDLTDLIDDSENINRDIYTDDSLKDLDKELETAKDVKDNATDQTTVDKTYKDLSKTFDDLKVKDKVSNVGSSTNGPTTGVDNQEMIFIMLGALSMLVIYKKRKVFKRIK